MSVVENVEIAIEEKKAETESNKKSGAARYRDWCFTINNYDQTDINEIKAYFSDFCSWGIYGEEVGESKTPHLQGALYRTNPIGFKGLKKALGDKVHLERMIGTYRDSKIYCSKGSQSKEEWDELKSKGPNYGKDAKVFEHGNIPSQGKRNDFETVRDAVNSGMGMQQIVEIATSYQSIKTGEALLKYKEVKRNFKPLIMWFYGPTGCGKTYYAWEIAKMYGFTTWCSAKNLQWFEGYDADECVIIDDIRRDFCPYAELLLLLDRYPYRVMNKGGSRQMLAKLMIITCPKSPTELFCHAEGSYNAENDIGQLMRRIDYICQIGPGMVWPWERVPGINWPLEDAPVVNK